MGHSHRFDSRPVELALRFWTVFGQGVPVRRYVEGENVVFETHHAPGNTLALRQVISESRRGNIDLAVSSGPATRAMTIVTDVSCSPAEFCVHGPRANLKGFLRLSLITCWTLFYRATSRNRTPFNQVNKDTERS